MKKNICFFLILLCTLFVSAQTTQLTLGSTSANENFYDVKFDASGGSVKVGISNNSATGNDCFIVKTDKNKQVIWQKTIPNTGDDFFNHVIVCSNGDYVAIGQIYVNNIRRAFVQRFNAGNGNIIWSYISANSTMGELFWDGVELANHNIVLVGADSFQPGQTNSFIVMLTENGSLVWSKVSNRPLADEFRAIALLPNGNLIINGFYNPGDNYNAVMIEMNSSTGAILSESSYSISRSIQNAFVNSMWGGKIYIKNNKVWLGMNLFQGFGSSVNFAVFNYDQSTKNLTGNIYYHSGNTSGAGSFFYPLADNDLVIGQYYSSPVAVYLSRVTNGTIVSDKQLSANTKNIAEADIDADGIFNFSGAYSTTSTNGDAFELYANSKTTSITTCGSTDANKLNLIPLTLTATPESPISLLAASAPAVYNPTFANTSFAYNNICESAAPGTGTGLQGAYYNGTSLTGTPLLTRTDTTINFEWTYAHQPLTPAPGIVPEDMFSVRWSGQVQPQFSENYTFSALTDDGVRVWVNGVKLIDNWVNQDATEKSGSISLVAGQKYDIVVEYYENTGNAVAKLSWSSASTPKQIIPKSQLYPPVAPPAAGTGLQGVYYNGINLAGNPLLTRTDTTVNFEWTYSHQPLSPAPGVVPEDMFSVRWTGQVQPQFTELYTFYTLTDDGVRLWVNGVKLVDNWVNQDATEKSGTIMLQAGQKYDIVLEYFENTGNAVSKLSWSSASTAKQIIPKSRLFPPVATSGTGLQGTYYDGINLTSNPLLTRVDPTINFEWTYTHLPLSPAPGTVPEDKFSVRWTGQVQPLYSETYTFYTVADDGIRLWVNGVKLVDNWVNQGATEKSGTITLQAGQKYNIRIDYFENTGEAIAKLYWSSASTPKQIVPISQLFPTGYTEAPMAPQCVNSISPADQESLSTTTTATISWQPAADATSYDVYLYVGGVAPSSPTANVTTTSYSASGLIAGALYSWYVAPRNANGAATGCAATNTVRFRTAFETFPPPSCTVNKAPAAGATVPIDPSQFLLWASVPDATTYFVYIWTGSTPSTEGINASSTGIPLTSPQLNLKPGTTYTWYVAPFSRGGQAVGCAGTATTFTTAPANARIANAANLQITDDGSSVSGLQAALTPNPVKAGQPARVQIGSNKTTVANLTLNSAGGKRISTNIINLVKGINTTSINTGGLAPGLYLLNIAGTEKPVTLKLIVE